MLMWIQKLIYFVHFPCNQILSLEVLFYLYTEKLCMQETLNVK